MRSRDRAVHHLSDTFTTAAPCQLTNADFERRHRFGRRPPFDLTFVLVPQPGNWHAGALATALFASLSFSSSRPCVRAILSLPAHPLTRLPTTHMHTAVVCVAHKVRPRRSCSRSTASNSPLAGSGDSGQHEVTSNCRIVRSPSGSEAASLLSGERALRSIRIEAGAEVHLCLIWSRCYCNLPISNALLSNLSI